MYEVDQYTVSLLHFEDGIKDECGNTWTVVNGNVVVNTDQKVVGSNSLYTPANSFLTSVNDKYAFGDGDFTIDFWMYYESSYSGVASTYTGGIGIAIQPDEIWFGSSTSIQSITKYPQFVSNNWAHYALVRKSGTVYWFVNGKLKTTISMNSKIDSNKFAINSRYISTGCQGGAAYYDEFRISNIARWTQDFIPGQTSTPIFSPTSLIATSGDSQVALSWTAVSGTTGYSVKRSITASGPYATIATNVPGTSYVDNTVTNGTTYYYVVTAVNEFGESANSNEASATPQAPSGQGLLRITMSDSSEREYKLSTAEIENFIKWYNRTVCTGNTCYAFDDIVDSSKEYLSFDKIISFKVLYLKD